MPDIYDSAKYDAIHNSELGLNMKQLYTVSFPLHPGHWLLAAGNRGEYGISTLSVIAIGE